MAVRYRQGRASPWQCYWNNPLTGKRECANFATRPEAEKHDSLIKHRLKFDRESFREEAQEETEPTLEACYLQYLKRKQFTRKGLAWQMDAMRFPLRKFGTMAITAISKNHLEELKEEMLAMPVKTASARGRLSVLRTVLRWCAARGWMSPVDFPPLPPARYERLVPPTPEELALIMAHASPHIVRVILLGAQCGVRVGPCELFQLTWDDVDFSRGVLRVHGSRKNLNAPWREVPIRKNLLPTLAAWKTEDEARGIRFLIHYRGRPVEKIGKAWRESLRRAGISRRIRPYDLRHAFATELIAAGKDMGTIAKLMGHSGPAMLLTHYQYVMDSQKRAAVESLPDIAHVPMPMCPNGKPLVKSRQVPDAAGRSGRI